MIYASNNDAKGKYDYSNTILHPYIGWFPEEDLKLWASVGFGSGEVEIGTEVSKYSTDTYATITVRRFQQVAVEFHRTNCRAARPP